MADGPRGAVLKSIDTLFRVGTIGALTDAELIDLFLTRRDGAESAFETLVRRHGPMVFGVCRGVLNDPNDAEDAFQATFLVLARRAPSIRRKASMGSWLHGVARRVALRARADAARRRLHENRAAERVERRESISSESDCSSSDLARILHEELGRLPEKYRAPVLLCDGEGLTHEHAARRLGWPVGTVSGRLSRAHGLLRDRLKRRGVEPCSIVVGGAAVSSSVVGKTARAAVLFATQTGVPNAAGISTTIPAGAFALAKGVLRTMSITRTITAGVLIMAGVGFTTAGAGFLAVHGQKATAKVEEKPKTETAKPNELASKEEILRAIREAAKAAQGITPGDGFGTKAITLANVGEAFANAGDRSEARKTYQLAVQSLSEEAINRKSELDRVRNKAHLLSQLDERTDNVIVVIIDSQARSGFIEDAADTATRIHDDNKQDEYLLELAKAKAQQGDIEAALRIGGKFSTTRNSRSLLFDAVAHIQAMHYPKTDRSWIDKISEPNVKSRAYLGLAAGLSHMPYVQSRYAGVVKQGGQGGVR